MAGPNLGTLLIQRLDAALGTTLSQQTQMVNRATHDPVTHAERSARPEALSNTLARDGRANVDRATLAARSGARVDRQAAAGDASGPSGRGAGAGATTSATTTLGLAARIILSLFADPTASRAAITARAPLLGQAPGQAPGATGGGGQSAPTVTAAPSGSGLAPGSGGSNALASAGGTAAHAAGSTGTTGGATAAGSATVAASSGGPQGLAQVLAKALSQNLQYSGLFYESHLRGLLSGQYRLADIQHEPQAQLGRGHAGSNATGTQASAQSGAGGGQTTAAGGAGPTTVAPGMPAAGSPAAGQAASTAQGGLPHGGLPTTPGTALPTAFTPGVDPATHGLVRQQLEALADQTIQWRGELWPGATMEWQVRRQTDDRDPAQSHAQGDTPWETDIRLQLPRLGDIAVTIRLAGKQVHVTVQANDDITPFLREHTDALVTQMHNQQLELATFTVVNQTVTPPHPTAAE